VINRIRSGDIVDGKTLNGVLLAKDILGNG
jgi:hypothetical protein